MSAIVSISLITNEESPDEFILHRNNFTKNRRYNRDNYYIPKRLFSEYIKYNDTDKYYYISCKNIFWRQGWKFNNKLFKVVNSKYIAYDKSKAIKYIRYLLQDTEQIKDAIEAINNLKDDDKFILKIAY